ncbi:Hypothetical predicted protein [Mytilus galloprovincialis]|uniref:Uncharacterized protein n=1 Tax=Mytilus galloprovincialis TaxID=29158 RepID=A0A8B6HC28_MYTGA|nr:Hypothetical predicted protein [Mytilus galloprovincialis]
MSQNNDDPSSSSSVCSKMTQKSALGKRKRPLSNDDFEELSSASNSNTSVIGDGDIPSKTNEWNAELISNRLHIHVTHREYLDPYSHFMKEYLKIKQDSKFCNCILEQFPNLIKDPDPPVAPTFIVDITGQDEINTSNIANQQKQIIEKQLAKFDDSFKLRIECFEYVFNCWDDLDCEYINQINISHALKKVQELDCQFEKSSLYLCEWFNRKSKEKKVIVLEMCRWIFYGLKLFYDQLLFMMNHSHNGDPVTEKMFLDLFTAFVRIFHLKIYDTTKTEHYFTIGEREFISEPDAIIYKFTESESCDAARLESSVFVVAKVKQYCKDKKKDRTSNLRHASDDLAQVADHIASNVKGQHIGDMLAVTQSSSALGNNGVFGFIVQGTKVTLTSLKVGDDFFESKGFSVAANGINGTVNYSKQCNILLKRGRHELIPVMLSMATLFKSD